MAADPVAEAFSGFPWATMTRTGVDPMKPTEPCCDEPAFVCVSCGDDHKCDIATLRAALDGLVVAGENMSAYTKAGDVCLVCDYTGDTHTLSCPWPRLNAALAAAKETP